MVEKIRTEVFHSTHSFYDSILEYSTGDRILRELLIDDVWQYFYQHIRETLMDQPAIERAVLHYMDDENRYESEIRLHGDIVYVTIYDTYGYELSVLDIELFKVEIDLMSHYDMAKFFRFAESEHVIVQTQELWAYYFDRFQGKGGMTTEISREVGWGNDKEN